MSRLIDADSITEKIMNAFEETLRIALKSGTYDLEGVMLKIKCYLDNEPTAFDVDKVVSELEKSHFHTDATFDDDGYCNDDSEEVVNLNEAIEIVKVGGIDGNSKNNSSS